MLSADCVGARSSPACVEQTRAGYLTYRDCKHEQRTLTRRVNSSGRDVFLFQCDHCRQSVGEQQRRPESGHDLVPMFDHEARDRIREEITREWAEHHREKRRADHDAWLAEAQRYYRSKRWKVKREAVLLRDVVCTACRVRRAVQAHHLTYEHFGDEPLFDLVGVCFECHVKITEMDRERRLK